MSEVPVNEIQGLRGLSAVTVLLYHALGFGAVAALYLRFGFGGGYAAVYVFFALSAYLLTRTEPRSWTDYYTHRVFRIFPVWLVVLPLFVLVGLIPLSPASLLILQNWFPSVSGIANPSWTLSIELVFYAVLPLWLWLFRRVTVSVTIACFALTAVCALWVHGAFVETAALSLASYAVGTLAARERWPALGVRNATALMLAAFAVSAVVLPLAPLVTAVAAGCLLMNVPKGLARFGKMGGAAYPIYLLGYPMLFLGRILTGNPWLVLGFDVATVLALAWLLHLYVEQPFIQFGRRVCEWRRNRSACEGLARAQQG